jgi:tRNA-splicing ligase RtcB (3'-phosphate/5'-hydroxy nucleic acid ligase)
LIRVYHRPNVPRACVRPVYGEERERYTESRKGLSSASYGAGRKLSRKQAKDRFSWHATKANLEKRSITVLSAAADEVPGVYKDIEEVMASQADLVEKVARFEPRIVRMAGEHDGPPED